MGVSRTPAREALTRLAAENLLEKIPNKGFVVKEFQEKEKLDTYEVIGVLDALAGELSLQYLTANEISRMEELLEMMEISIKYKNYESYLSISNEFHNIYRDKCENKTLLKVINSLVYNFIPKSYSSESKEELFKMLSHSNKEHVRLLRGMKEKDSKQVNDILKKHWDTVSINEMR